ncbi:MAG TPA: 2-oxoacid:acceptor oxidoreductase family protein [Thermoanaerobaculia bacterium]|nr:2-oxoacid:acceptor oxidoreductase family protein [Thermoanaerobaculia bacterium]
MAHPSPNRQPRNVVALGALQAATELFPAETFLTAIRLALKEKCAMIPLNEEAFEWGRRAVQSH